MTQLQFYFLKNKSWHVWSIPQELESLLRLDLPLQARLFQNCSQHKITLTRMQRFTNSDIRTDKWVHHYLSFIMYYCRTYIQPRRNVSPLWRGGRSLPRVWWSVQLTSSNLNVKDILCYVRQNGYNIAKEDHPKCRSLFNWNVLLDFTVLQK